MKRTGVMICITMALTCGVFAGPVYADLDTWMRFVYDDYPTSPLAEPIDGAGDQKLYMNELHFRAVFDWDVGDRGSTARFRFLYGWFNIDLAEFNESEDTPRFDKSIYSEFEFTFRQRYNNPWGWQVRIAPGSGFYQFDLKSAREWTMQGGLWGVRAVSPGWLLGLGAVHTYAFGNPTWTPSLIAEYSTGGDLKVEAELPTLARLTWDWNYNVDLGAVFRIEGHRYARNPENYGGALIDPYLIHSVTTLAGTAGYRFDDALHFRLESGYMFDRVVRIMEGDETYINGDPEQGFFFRTVLTWGGDAE